MIQAASQIGSEHSEYLSISIFLEDQVSEIRQSVRKYQEILILKLTNPLRSLCDFTLPLQFGCKSVAAGEKYWRVG